MPGPAYCQWWNVTTLSIFTQLLTDQRIGIRVKVSEANIGFLSNCDHQEAIESCLLQWRPDKNTY